MNDLYLDIKPCPCCSGEAEMVEDRRGNYFFIRCKICSLAGKKQKTKYMALTLWNTRPENLLVPIRDGIVYPLPHGWTMVAEETYLRFESAEELLEISMDVYRVGMKRYPRK